LLDILKKIVLFLGIVLATIFSYICVPIFTAVFSILALPFLLMRAFRVVWLIEMVWARLSFWVGLKHPRIYGKENLDNNKAYLICSNHSSVFDIPALCLIQTKMFSWVAKRSLFLIPFFGNALALGIAIPIDRQNARATAASLKRGLKQAGNKRSVIIFPEGTRTKDGYIMEFKQGFVKLARSRGLDILPVTLQGLYSFKPAGKPFYINPKEKIEIIIHKPISIESLSDMKGDEVADMVKDIIEKDYSF
jgi:1-acyl-sn-glycerol-3-phosphate acyltransferase